MRFCVECGSMMTKVTSTDGQIIFSCRCLLVEEGTPEDTLMEEELLESNENTNQHAVLVENAAFDTAANIVMKDCPKCRLNFMTMIHFGSNETTMFTCTCGFKTTQNGFSEK